MQIIMSPLLARTGRHRQRYDAQLRLVAGCIPYRLRNDDDHNCDLEKRLEVLMISSPNRDDLVFPKGGWEDDETVHAAACREALEEAGVSGILDENQLGEWEFRSKSKQDSCSQEGGCKGFMYALEVTKELDSWPEQANHERKWLTVIEAFKLCRYDWMREALGKFCGVLSKQRKHELGEDLVKALERFCGVLSEHKIKKHELGEDFVKALGFCGVLSEHKKHELGEDLVGPPLVPVQDVVEHQMLPPSCCVNPTGTQHRDESYNCYVLG